MPRPSEEIVAATIDKAVAWHILQTHPFAEKLVSDQLKERAIESFLPMRLPERWRQKHRPVPKRPAFPRYIFAGIPQETHRSRLFSMRGEVRVMSAAGELLVVPPKVMLELFDRTDTHGFIAMPGPNIGDPVRIAVEPFAGLLGELTRIGGRNAQIWVKAIGATMRLPLSSVEFISRRD